MSYSYCTIRYVHVGECNCSLPIYVHGYRSMQVQSQDDLISKLSRQLKESRQENALLQNEFSQYRKHSQVCIIMRLYTVTIADENTQRLLRESVLTKAEDWIKKETHTVTHNSTDKS